MGLCKCPKRKATDIFCYEHRVNVCEDCIVHNHTKCVVDTYRNWIGDAEFSRQCGLCAQDLASADTIRLLCFHLVHWDCLDAWARSMPATTAPAGYSCPICKQMCLFPPMNQVSPIADALRFKMGTVNWARAGLGLPLLDNEISKEGGFDANANTGMSLGSSGGVFEKAEIPDLGFEPTSKFNRTFESESPQPHVNHIHSYPSTNIPVGMVHNSHYAPPIQNHFYDTSTDSTNATYIPRKTLKSEFEMESTGLLIDEDDHKYRRRSPFESLSRWIKNSATVKNRRGRKRTALYVLLGFIAFVILLMFMFGRSESDDDNGNFNPEANPNVMIGGGLGIAGNHPNSEDNP